ncbi:MAG: hypothetical protein UY48_C0053G0002 [Candidatus Gottesmanbacteria bacterium GW2011_GWB1_49_7]|uniref:Uncharacterized protein n=1 Tax=Candidatus Gottesmanbacteria bacterium GW2011_GWB1_49_7 TaxID=1618448 RepID=A0A0G1VU29_9BACT|nr:MAG: hypothetical protein UY48_C0053G0002 [Candidatus Gottesmanbacteria bacterium GW2011_GWB1_49_7]
MKKVCKGCHNSLPPERFGLCGRGTRRAYCRDCVNIVRRKQGKERGYTRKLYVDEKIAYAYAARTKPIYFALAGRCMRGDNAGR